MFKWECALYTYVFLSIKKISLSMTLLDTENLVKHQVPGPESNPFQKDTKHY